MPSEDETVKWYYAQDHEKTGPFTEPEFQNLVRDGQVVDDTLVWNTEMAGWVPYGELAGRDAALRPATSSVRPEGDVLAVAAAETVTAESPDIVYGPFWTRFFAKLIDIAIVAVLRWIAQVISFLIVAVAGMLGDTPASVASFLFGTVLFAVDAAYCTWFVGRFGATPGKMALGLKIVRADLSPISYQRAFCRYLGEILSAAILLIGYIIAAFDDEKRTLHDYICDTRVLLIRK